MPSEEEIEAAAAALPFAATIGAAAARVAARLVLEAADRVRAPKAFACADGAAMRANHRARAKQAMADEACSTDLTDGFCGPQDGRCHWDDDKRPARRTCSARAEGMLRAIESRGCVVVWEHDPTLRIAMEKKP